MWSVLTSHNWFFMLEKWRYRRSWIHRCVPSWRRSERKDILLSSDNNTWGIKSRSTVKLQYLSRAFSCYHGVKISANRSHGCMLHGIWIVKLVSFGKISKIWWWCRITVSKKRQPREVYYEGSVPTSGWLGLIGSHHHVKPKFSRLRVNECFLLYPPSLRTHQRTRRQALDMASRKATVTRNTNETQIECSIDLGWSPSSGLQQEINVSTGIGFLDHVRRIHSWILIKTSLIDFRGESSVY